jgi:apolipoprotein N-acyltransferase
MNRMKFQTFFSKKIVGDSLALIAGILLTLAFAPYEIFPFAVIAPAILLGTWLYTTPQRAFWRGWLFGAGLFGSGVYWVFISIHTFGGTPVWLAAFITAGLVAILSLMPGLNGYLLNRYFPNINRAKILLAFPVIWVFLEWVRSWIFSGFPWLLIGTSQINSPLKGFAPIFSVYGVSLAVTLCSALLVYAVMTYRNKQYKALYFSIFVFALIWVAGSYLSFINWTKPVGKPIQVSLVQGNIAQDLKWSADQIQPTLDKYARLTQAHWDSKIVIWPESAIPVPLHIAQNYVEAMAEQALKNHSTWIFGIPVRSDTQDGYYNAVFALGEGKGFYTKHRLVPFGEYIPLHQFLGKLLQFMDIPMSDFVAGKEKPQPLQVEGIHIDTFICYEIAYPEQVLSYNGDTNLLLTVSNDAWFGESIAQAQHFEIAQMRALEMGRPVLFVSNNGITGIITPQGKVQKTAPPYTETVLTDKVQPTQGKTPWQKFGMDPILLILLIMLFNAIRFRKK